MNGLYKSDSQVPSLIFGHSAKELLNAQHGLLRKLVEVEIVALAVFAAIKDLEAEDASETRLKHRARDLLDGQVAVGVRESSYALLCRPRGRSLLMVLSSRGGSTLYASEIRQTKNLSPGNVCALPSSGRWDRVSRSPSESVPTNSPSRVGSSQSAPELGTNRGVLAKGFLRI